MCRVVPCRACSTLRGISARCTEVIPYKVFATLMHTKAGSFPRGSGNAFSTLRGTNARYAAWFRSRFSQPCVIQRRVMLKWFRSAWFRPAQLFVSDQRGRLVPQLGYLSSSRPTRACSGRRFASSEIVRFSASVSVTMSLPSIGGGAAKAQPVGRVSVRERASISNDAFWCSS